MAQKKSTRREFISRTAGVAAAGVVAPYFWTSSYAQAQDKNDKLNVAAIGVGGRGSAIGRQAAKLGNMVACADVDLHRAEAFAKKAGESCQAFQDYRKILEQKEIDAVTIGTPDHWHVKIAIDALNSGKHVYCEKPLTLTIDEGKILQKVVKDTGMVFQVGTQQRSEYNQMFIKAAAIAQSGRLGKTLKARASVGTARSGGPFKESEPPEHLDWNMWLGQAPETPYIRERTHYEFRWWLEYSGGQVTDWGVHHTDIAMWALGLQNTGPQEISGKGKFNKEKNCYNVAHTFDCQMKFEGGHEIVLNSGKNELIIEGEDGKLRVNRGGLTGKPVEESNNSPEKKDELNEAITKLYKGRKFNGHMNNFFECIKDGSLPISDVYTHHRSVSACHLCNIAMRVGGALKWDPEKEDFIDNEMASSMLSRKQREPFQTTA